PATCSAATGRCACPSILNLVVSFDLSKETCRCPGHPFVYLNGTECADVSGETWILLYYKRAEGVRVVPLNTPESASLEIQV
ncbi:unnamed protein product, partial [Rotaria sp. Silwood2]